MNATLSPGNPSEKRTKLASFAALLFLLLRMFWVTELILLLVVLYGLYAGWSESSQWSDAFFYAAIAQMAIASTALVGTRDEISSAYQARKIVKGNVSETRHMLAEAATRKETFSLRVFIGSILTLLIAVLAM